MHGQCAWPRMVIVTGRDVISRATNP
ncbi:hypothetical protein E2C01_037340 [Portunus trituberculatus]|uniref:Uncharacterized protein n=1 Tax=Portunus trituberculatus TaxID=210409 RepID=A0A5B7FFD2_PORTR|nr:hypothetical protein [Portunus trituberculatus]